MTVISQSLADVLKQILQSFQIPFLFPAAVIVLVTLLLYSGEIKIDDPGYTVIAVTATVVLSYLLYAINIPLIRLLEGYIGRENWFFRWLRKFEERRHQKITEQIDHYTYLRNQADRLENEFILHDLLTEERQKRLQRIQKLAEKQDYLKAELQLRFPTRSSDDLLPTALGNTIAAFEIYPWRRYRIDAIHLWPRLVPILTEKKFMSFVQNEKAILDFLLNIGLTMVIISLELLVFSSHNKSLWYLIVSIFLLVFSYVVIYHTSVIAARNWGAMVRVAFDLHREDLRRALYLPPFPDEALNYERGVWEKLSRFIVYGDHEDYNIEFPGFYYSQPQQQNDNQ